MKKHQSETEKSSDTESNNSEQEYVGESVSSEYVQKKGNVQKKKKGLKTKVSKSDSHLIQNEIKQRMVAASTKQSRLKKSDSNSPEPRKEFKNHEDQPKSTIWTLLLCIILSLFVLIIICYLLPGSASPDKQFDVASIMKNLKGDFNGQNEMNFRIINAALSRVATENPTAPGILILIASHNARSLRDSFSSQLAKSIALSTEYVSIENNPFKMPEETKVEIDDSIKNNLTHHKMNVVLVKNLDKIPFEAAMIFHSYCDHENAPFKKTVYIMTVTLDEAIKPTFGPREWDALATKRLNSVWKNSSEDQVSSLISRLTVNVCAIVAKT